MRAESAAADRKLTDLAAEQAGMVTRAQAVDCGMTWSRIRQRLATGRWQPVHHGVYATFSGQLARASVLWAAVLCAGPGAVLSHETAAEVWGLSQRPSHPIRVSVGHRRGRTNAVGVLITRSKYAESARHPTRLPPRTRVEDTVVDLTQTAGRLEDAISWLARAIGGRLTTAPRVLACFESRPKLRWRAALCAAVRDVEQGSHSWLELAYLRAVERAHGLPRSQRQLRRDSGHYDDVRYPAYRVRVELDGHAAHPEHKRFRDRRRDNAAVVEGDHVLRYGSGDVGEDPCDVAAEVASLLRRGGWTGSARSCGRAGCGVSS